MLYLKLAWRNIWRNKRRTIITMMSVVMAVMLSSVMSSMQEGQYAQMIDNTVGTFSGHLQVQKKGYHDKPTLDNSFEADSSILSNIASRKEVAGVIPRLDSYVLAAGKERSKAAMVVGIDVDKEKKLSKPDQKIIAGKYFTANNERSVLVSQGLAEYLKVSLGDTLVLLGQGFHGMSAAAAYPIGGIMKFGLPDMNKNLAYLPIQTAQDFYGAYGRLTAAVLLLKDPAQVHTVAQSIQPNLTPNLVILTWQSLMPELVQAIQADRGSGYILFLILYMVVSFGIFGTVLMMTAERKFEFGVMLAIGTARLRIAGMLIYEMIFITILGALLGMLSSLPIILYFNKYPLEFTGATAKAVEEYGMEPFFRFSSDPSILLNQGMIILVITLIISLYPLWHTHKLKPVEAMRQ
jgi:ABC-type lipoprotein release transport system permease subunit